MKKTIAILGLIILTSFTTQQPATLKFEVTIDEANTILKALSKLPFDESAGIINKLQLQASQQLSDTTKKNK